MPQQVLPDATGFAWFSRELTFRGFRPVSEIEFKSDFKRLKLKAPRSRVGREAGFAFFANGLTVRVWTTWLEREGKARDIDAGWVLICDGDKPLYFSYPIHRTKNFLVNLLRQAWLARWRVMHRPLCSKCRQFMNIAMGRGIKSRYWRCNRLKEHEDRKPFVLDWDYGLPPKAKRYAKTLRKKRAKYRAKRKQESKPIFTAIQKRRPWQRNENPTRVVHCKKESYDVYIGRPSEWGNPFRIEKEKDRQWAIDQFKAWIKKQPQLLSRLGELRGKVLGCWCKPKTCHGDVLAELADKQCHLD